jgi:hypothetical protein
MKSHFIAALCVLICVFIARTVAQPTQQSTAQKLFASLSDEQKKLALVPFDAPERTKQKYEGGPRPGVQIKELSPEQQKLAEELVTQFTSAYGKQKAIAIADQPSNTKDPTTGFGRYYLCFFGDPTKEKNYAWRVAEHHLTIVHVEVENGKPTTFGPILLGANPPNLWDAEEEKMIALYAAMNPGEREKSANGGKSNSSEFPKPNVKSIKLAELNPTARRIADELIDLRLSFFAEPIQQQIRALLDQSGGADALKLVFYGAAEKKCRDGGRWDFKMFNDSFLCDYENTRAHIHLSLKSGLK